MILKKKPPSFTHSFFSFSFFLQALREGQKELRPQYPHETSALTESHGCSDQQLSILGCCVHFARVVCTRPDMITLLTADATLTKAVSPKVDKVIFFVAFLFASFSSSASSSSSSLFCVLFAQFYSLTHYII